MARIFISHSSQDNAEAIALVDWLSKQGWKDEIFLDLDPERGIIAGERWERKLREAADRCEVVLFLISKAWLDSKWCLRELELANKLNKRPFGLLIEDIPLSDLPVELTSAWQLLNLATGSDHQQFTVTLPITQEQAYTSFSKEGLQRLKNGLELAGLNAKFFAWPPDNEPDRAPYHGLRALEKEDAGIFFGRDAQIVYAMDRLRGIRDAAPPRMMVILGASGAGKSSFMKAGLLPRLERDDRHFFSLPVIRPEKSVINGEAGLVNAIEQAYQTYNLPIDKQSIRQAIANGAAETSTLLQKLTDQACQKALIDQTQGQKPPTLIVPIDQAEELFLSDGAEEAKQILELLSGLMKSDMPAIATLFTIRSDSYDALQTAKAFEGITQQTISLPPMPKGAYRDVITGPAKRLKDTGRSLEVEEDLVDQLLRDIEKGGAKDALPLLAFTLERLYSEYKGQGALKLEGYHALGAIKGAIEASVEEAFKKADSFPTIPKERKAREALLKRGLIPWVAGIDPETGSPRRRTPKLSSIPEEARPLMELLVKQRLLATDTNEAGEVIIEPAHEALLRQWSLLNGWLEEDFENLAILEGVKRASADWQANNRDPEWLSHSGGRLEEARKVRQARPDLAEDWQGAEEDYLLTSVEKEETLKKLEQQRFKREKRRNRITVLASLLVTIGLAIFSFYSYDLSINSRFNEILFTLRNNDVEQATNKFRELALTPAIGFWNSSKVAKSVSTEMLDTAIVLPIPWHIDFADYAGVYGEKYRDDDTRGKIACSNNKQVCIANFLMDARGAVTGFFVGKGDLFKKSDGVFDKPKEAKKIFQPDPSKNSMAVSEDGAWIAISEDSQIHFWNSANFENDNFVPIQSIRLQESPESIAFIGKSRNLLAVGKDSARFITLEPRRYLGDMKAEVEIRPIDKEIVLKNNVLGDGLPRILSKNASSNRVIPLNYDRDEKSLDFELSPTGKLIIENEQLNAEINSVIGFETSNLYQIQPRILALTLDNKECSKYQTKKELQNEPFADLLILSLTSDYRKIENAWKIVCGPTQIGSWGSFHRLAVSVSRPKNRQRIFISGRIFSGLIELRKDGRPLRQYAMTFDSPKIILPRILSEQDSSFTMMKFEKAPNRSMASEMIYHGNHDLITFFGASYNSPSGSTSIGYIDLKNLSSGTFPNRFVDYFDRIYALQSSEDGHYVASKKESSGLELFSVRNRVGIRLPLRAETISPDKFKGDTLEIILANQDKITWSVPELYEEQFDKLKSLILKYNPNINTSFTRQWREYYKRKLKRELTNNNQKEAKKIELAWITKELGAKSEINKLWATALLKQVEERLKQIDKNKSLTQRVKLLNETTVKLKEVQIRAKENHVKIISRANTLLGRVHKEEQILALMIKADKAWKEKNYQTAIDSYDQIIPWAKKINDDNRQLATAYFDRGRTKVAAGKYKEAISDFEQAIKLKHEKAQIWHWWTKLDHASHVVQKDPVGGFRLVAWHYLKLTQPLIGKRVFRMLELERSLYNFFSPLANLYVKENFDHTKAPITDCDRLASHKNDPFRITKSIAISEIVAQAAIKACDQAIEKNANQPRYYLNRSRAYSKAADDAKRIGQNVLANAILKKMHADLDKAMEFGYPIAFNNKGYAYGAGNGVSKDKLKQVELYLETFNRIIHCCWLDVSKHLLQQQDQNQSQIKFIVHELTKWAVALGADGAELYLKQLYDDGTLEPSPALLKATFKSTPPWLSDLR